MAKNKKTTPPKKNKSLETWIWDAACSIRGAQEAPKYKNYILPLIFTKRLCDVYDDELKRVAQEIGSMAKARQMVAHDWEQARKMGNPPMVRFYLPFEPQKAEDPTWDVIRKLTDKVGETLTGHLITIAQHNPRLEGIINRIDFNATTHGSRDIDDDRLSNLIESISEKRLGLKDVEPDIIGRSYEYLIRKFAEGGGQSAGEFYTPTNVGLLMARILQPQPGMSIYDPTCGSGGLLVKCELELERLMHLASKSKYAPLQLYGQEYVPETFAMAWMNMIIHDMEGRIEIGDTFKNPQFRKNGKLQTFDRAIANPMWNQDWFSSDDYEGDEWGRFPKGAGFPGKSSADWGWVQHIWASLSDTGRAAIVLDTGAASRGSGNANSNKEKEVRQWFVEQDLVEGVIYLPENLFYNTSAPGIVLIINKQKPAAQKGKVLLLNAAKHFVKGDPKNYIPDESLAPLAQAYLGWKDIDKLARVVPLAELQKNDYNLSPSRYIQVNEAESYRPIAEIVAELKSLEAEEAQISTELKTELHQLGIDY